MERIVLYTERKAINQPLRSQSGYSTFDQPLDRYDASTSTTVSTEITPRPPPSRLSVVVISVVTVVTSVMMTVSLPVFSGTMNSVGGDTFVVLFYGTAWTPVVCFAMLLIYKVSVNRTLSLLPSSGWRVLVLMGLTNALNGVFVVFSSSPSRTAPYLQGILSTSLIPFTVACRFLLLRKGISLRRLGCTIAVLIGLFITIEPLIWSLPGSGNDTSSGGSSSARIIWPMIFVLGFLPAAINVVICERELKKEEVHSVTFFTWCMVTQVVSIMSLFWVDFLPFFGMASSLNDFKEHLHNGFKCNFSSSPSCNNLPLKAWAFIAGFCLANISQFLLIQKAEGAIYAVVVQSMVTPIASLFWTFFKYEVSNDRFYWDPEFTETTVFTLGGLVIIVPAVVLYNIFSIEDAKESELKRLQDRTNDTTILRL